MKVFGATCLNLILILGLVVPLRWVRAQAADDVTASPDPAPEAEVSVQEASTPAPSENGEEKLPDASVKNVSEEALPATTTAGSEAKPESNFLLDPNKPSAKSGNIYVSSKKKNELLQKTNIWGSVHFPGIHYVPVGTNLLSAISIAGGPTEEAATDSVTLSTTQNEQTTVKKYSLEDALQGGADSNPVLMPGDTIFIARNDTRQRVTFWMSIGTFFFAVLATSFVVADRLHKK